MIRAGQALQTGEDIDGAIQAYSCAMVLRTLARVRAYALVCRGSAKDEARDFDGAVADYDEAIALAPDDPSAWFMRGIAYQARENWLAALHDFDAAIERDSESAEFYEARGLARLCVANWRGAREDLARAIVLAALRLTGILEDRRRTGSSGVHERALLISRRRHWRSA